MDSGWLILRTQWVAGSVAASFVKLVHDTKLVSMRFMPSSIDSYKIAQTTPLLSLLSLLFLLPRFIEMQAARVDGVFYGAHNHWRCYSVFGMILGMIPAIIFHQGGSGGSAFEAYTWEVSYLPYGIVNNAMGCI